MTSTVPSVPLVTVQASSLCPRVRPRAGAPVALVARVDDAAAAVARPSPVTATAVTPAIAATPATPRARYARLRPRSSRPRRTVCSSGTSRRTSANESRTAVINWSSFIAAPVR